MHMPPQRTHGRRLPARVMAFELQIADEVANEPLFAPQGLDDLLGALQQVTGDSRLEREICLRICGDAESHALNLQYRGKAHPTNVLSFSAVFDWIGDAPPEIDRPLGDLAVCGPVVAREAASQGKTWQAHMMHLLAHGVLHLLGFDHQTSAEATQMENLEVEVLAKLGVANPY